MSFSREQLLLAVTGIVLAVMVLQAFQLSGLVNKAQNAAATANLQNARLASSAGVGGLGAASQQPAAQRSPISSGGMVGGC